jgi:mRNA-degrading endonuclease RelE of RelBE toxin-antitoxin system
MPPYRVLWLEIAERQYLDLPEDTRGLVDERLAQLERDPFGLPDAVYDSSSDQWSAPVGGGLILYAVVAEPATTILLRVVVV